MKKSFKRFIALPWYDKLLLVVVSIPILVVFIFCSPVVVLFYLINRAFDIIGRL